MSKSEHRIELVPEPPDQLLVTDGRKHFRRRYALAEVRWGLLCGAVLLGIVGWVGWRGTQVDASLFSASPELLEPSAIQAPTGTGQRGGLPPSLSAAGWREEKLATFDASNLYVKINGRADFFLSFGFKRLDSLLLVAAEGDRSIDVEMYDLGIGPNALGAYAGERGEGVKTEAGSGGVWHRDRNALFLTRGRYYVRLIGSDETPAVVEQLDVLRARFEADVAGEPLPWGHAFFVGQLNLDPGKVSYLREGAFSFGFARDVYAATIGKDNASTEVFIVALADAKRAAALADRFNKGFLEYGQAAGTLEGTGRTRWYKDRYLDALSTAVAHERFVIGVRGAPDQAAARTAFKLMQAGVGAMSEELRGRAQPASEAPAPVEEHAVEKPAPAAPAAVPSGEPDENQ